MPANVYTDMNTNVHLMEDQQALQLAFELSLLGINGEDDGIDAVSSSGNLSPQSFAEEQAKRRSANMTECVPVPSSEHVAEIVGRQGCKIKALRAKTNTYIKTPVRGEEPVFVVTGRKDDVQAAKREILSAAEHFSQIRASRRNSSVSSLTGNGLSGPPSPNAPGQVTIQVRVPYRVVGLVVGPKGATIKRIQQQTHTYIVTPSRDKEPVFEVTGLPENVEKARQEIESHIALRTGGAVDNQPDDDFHRNGIDSGFHELNGSSSDFISSMFGKANGMSAFTAYNNALNGNNMLNRRPETVFNFPPVANPSKLTDFTGQMNGFGSALSSFPNIYDNLNDEGIGSPTFENGLIANVWSDVNDNHNQNLVSLFGPTSTTTASNGFTTVSRISPTSSEMSTGSSATGTNSTSHSPPSEHPAVRRIRSDPLASAFTPFNLQTELHFPTTTASVAPTGSLRIESTNELSSAEVSPMGPNVEALRRNCIMCSESERVAALVPCGHNLFCMECASLIVEKPTGAQDRICPVCRAEPSQAIRIIS
ncbi:MEX3B-like protein [Mya arenaria]|uniref:MEX3B-like protein n=1 Tax=Mya arenaria TaxID=6604 RepID=A0ABY7DRD8_MYAAR|nr:RNA-binding protein MEX3B-like [Mya arenaria]WAQ98905.1 MEX3B-like protein [Mya arenaria]